jgi:preprotein translocase subunit SecF
MADKDSLAARLHRGEVSYDFVGHRNRYYIASGILILISLLSLGFRGLHYGVEFEGGAVFTVQAPNATVSDAADAVASSGVDAGQPIITEIGEDRIRVQTSTLTTADATKLRDALAESLGVPADSVDRQVVGSSWGSEITKKAVTGLIVFLVLVVLYLSVAFEWKLAIAAIIALLHDLLVTAGVYSLIGFEVTPATVIGLLTILGYSLYDTVVVFDKVRENTRGIAGSNRWSYDQAANLAVNQTLVRSINTSVVALLPVAGLLVGGVILVGSGALKDLSLVLLVGIAVGAYSSIFIATPLAVQLKLTEPQLAAQRKRVLARQAHVGDAPAGGGAELATATTGKRATGSATATATAPSRPVVSAGSRQQPKRNPKAKRPSGKPKR